LQAPRAYGKCCVGVACCGATWEVMMNRKAIISFIFAAATALVGLFVATAEAGPKTGEDSTGVMTRSLGV